MPTAPLSTPASQTTQQPTDMRSRLLSVALKLFARRGFDGTSTREIVSEAGANQGHIPYYFGTKEKLWQEAVNIAFERLNTAMDPEALSLDTLPSTDSLAHLIRRYVHFAADYPEFILLMNEEGKQESPRMQWLVDTHAKPIFATLTALYKQAMRDGALRVPMPPPHFHYIFIGAVTQLFHQRPECKRIFNIDPMDSEVVSAHAQALVTLFISKPTELKE
ncbi:MAG: TetR/AcrR family transcriptional regulator [Parvibaculaceae bacterium]|nr:TetR/AcrR family transcriptional regulator [Parvibaculaceae bacterium]